MSRSRFFFAWMLVVAVVLVLVWSCTPRAVCSSRPLAAVDRDARGDADDEPCTAGGAVEAAGSGSGGASSGQRETWNDRRSLGERSPWSSPPSPLWNRPGTMPVPPPPLV